MAAKSSIFLAAFLLAAPAARAATTTPQASPAMAPAAPPAKTAVVAPRKPTRDERAEADRMEPLAQVAFWTRDLDLDPRDVDGAVKLAKALRSLGRFDEARAATERALVIAPSSVDALLEQGRAYIGENQGFFAIEPAMRAAKLAPKDWRPPSLLGVALEQAQRNDEARAAFEKALALAPSNPATLSNLAIFLAAHGESQRAEALLQKAVALPGAGPAERQNLALLVGLSGRFDEAERLERQDLPPEVVANDLAWLRNDQSVAPQRTWGAVASQR